ncbi:baseplate hub subunit [Synechococcus phage ACG-2014d]|jgi:hypothetical protein|uniref:Baseplate hub subunit n=1 Tax=Synechococcus phage ACG-2014d TaxID=1493509 RepID=A0A0E3ENJ4_9CAUD|nr:baseplate hub [Synechococcus phage ACG-2014d]YP_010355177.1 baseplate hub [Synechococcus phage ACG-2014d]AIX14619.1 baseplate hub subunit [Synechococcus phage ACG-2014d]AIX14839.1 baseplate hub subunit [Synechococcus phage ACG-2014d]AIX15266.1 baseplate hub subunit [Synechococcus phage ACG-2014d]AIX15484.1 baseplate hub subunit [Synechococcus phage ACG-2014d]AIX15913.1 baseplate hub subunit [Synechococcus phage ACG-2014d]
MPLPKLNVPRYELKLPSDGKRIKYRPFLVKEEKLLLLAMETEDQAQMVDTVQTLLLNCTNLSDTDIKGLATFDFEYIFLNIRAKSVGETVDLMVTSPDDNETQVKVTVDLSEIEVKFEPEHTNILKLDNKISMVMKYPSMDMFVKNNFETNSTVESLFELTTDCILQIVEGEEVYEAKESSKEELIEFLDQLNTTQFQEIQKFFETMPKLSHDIKFTNPKTKKKQTLQLEGLASFFA